jgi:hypothetical protein
MLFACGGSKEYIIIIDACSGDGKVSVMDTGI